MDLLIEKIIEKKNPSVFGLDPLISYVPKYITDKNFELYGNTLKGCASAILEFNKLLIDALYDVVPAVKPQSAYYELYGIHGLETLISTINYAKEKGLYVILDAKRNDIGSTAKAYSDAYLGKTVIEDGVDATDFNVDSMTVNAYLGIDGILPFLENCKKHDKSIFSLVKTSNPSSGELQDLVLQSGETVCEMMAGLVKKWGEDNIGKHGYSKIGAVVGATYPEQAKKLRTLMPNTYFLVPGYGAQGGNAKDVAVNFNKDGLGAIVNSSRGIMCAYKKSDRPEKDFALCARDEAIRMRDEINSYI